MLYSICLPLLYFTENSTTPTSMLVLVGAGWLLNKGRHVWVWEDRGECKALKPITSRVVSYTQDLYAEAEQAICIRLNCPIALDPRVITVKLNRWVLTCYVCLLIW